MSEEQKEKFENKGEFLSVHDAILQTLEANINGKYFSKEAFEKNIASWDGLPIIFAAEHPDMELFDNSQTEALQKINGEIVGSVTNPKIEITGHAKLIAQPVFNNRTEELNTLIKEGKLSLSTGFYGVSVDGKVTDVKPNHLLVFVEDDKVVPADRGSGFLNSINTLDKLLNQVKDLFNGQSKVIKEEKDLPDVKTEPTINERLKVLEDEYKGKIEVLNQQLEAANAELKTFREAEAARATEIKNQQWAAIKEKIPVGQLKGEGVEDKLRSEFDSDPGAFTIKVLNMVKDQPVGTDEKGEEFKQQQDKQVTEDMESQRKLQSLWRI